MYLYYNREESVWVTIGRRRNHRAPDLFSWHHVVFPSWLTGGQPLLTYIHNREESVWVTVEIHVVQATTVLNNSMVNYGNCMGNYGDIDNLA